MHLRSFPHTYIKGDERRLAYYSVEARELREAGWKQELTDAPDPEVEPEAVDELISFIPEIGEAAKVVDETGETEAEAVDFDTMTKRELLQYAMDRGVDLPDNALKADLVEACKAL